MQFEEVAARAVDEDFHVGLGEADHGVAGQDEQAGPRVRGVRRLAEVGIWSGDDEHLGRLVAESVARSAHLTRDGVKDGLEQVKRLPAASGLDGTIMGFGTWDRAALKGTYLVLRRWQGGRSIQVDG